MNLLTCLIKKCNIGVILNTLFYERISMFAKIGILGLGLIGGSLARALKKYNYPATIYGYNRNQDALMQAKT